MASEAQRLIGISLAKIAQSRVGRGGVSLHKNLLVATVLQKARYIFMEEAYHMVHGHYPQQCRQFVVTQQQHHHHHHLQHQQHCHGSNTIVGESQKSSMAPQHEQQHYHHQPQPQEQEHATQPKLVETNDTELEHSDVYTGSSVIVKNERKIENDKENSPPDSQGLTYFDLDKHKLQRISELGQKRRRQISELETEEAVLSILPKRPKSDLLDEDLLPLSNDNESSLIAECIAPEVEEISHLNSSYSSDCDSCETPMEIDRITSLVSIFSFGSLARSVSTPDLCSAQAKDSENTSQRTFLAMTV